jgi:cytochrome bd-type quinol oxidase subunit 2
MRKREARVVLEHGLAIGWNLFDWEPRLDWRAGGLLLFVVVLIGAIWILARAKGSRISRAVSLLVCIGLLSIGIYVLWPEAKTSGLFARESPSPLWYRAGRLVLLGAPSVFWVCGVRRARENGGAN